MEGGVPADSVWQPQPIRPIHPTDSKFLVSQAKMQFGFPSLDPHPPVPIGQPTSVSLFVEDGAAVPRVQWVKPWCVICCARSACVHKAVWCSQNFKKTCTKIGAMNKNV